jgi:hypothetical protein
VTQLKELAALVDKGILTQEVFSAQKARLLAMWRGSEPPEDRDEGGER